MRFSLGRFLLDGTSLAGSTLNLERLLEAWHRGMNRRRKSVVPSVGQTQPLEQRSLLSASPIGGEGNNVANPDWGTVGEQFVRIAPEEYGDGISSLAGADRPSAREISNEVAAEGEEAAPSRDLWSAMIWVWGQFVDHDLDLTDSGTTEPLSIAVPQSDPFFDPAGTGTKTINTMRSVFDASTGLSVENPRQQVNSLTSFIDASMVYGSDAARATALRTLSGGKLKTSEGDLLPRNSTEFFPDGLLANAILPTTPADQAFVAGDVRANENVVLTALHTIWVREHNFQAERIAADHPDWSDEQIYQGARERVIAEIQAITYNEFLPALIGRQGVGRYEGYDATVNPGISNEFATAGFRLGHTLLGEDIGFLDDNGNALRDEVPLREAFFNPGLFDEVGVDPLVKYMVSDPSADLDTKIVDSVRNFLFGPPGAGGFDLASLNIARGRDHGLADYNTVREAYGLPRVTSFSEITRNEELAGKLEELYGSVDNIDLWVGALAEDHRRGEGVGETLRAILVDQFSRLRAGDRFWYENQMSREEIAKINRTSLTDIIRRNTGVENIQRDAFFFRAEIAGHVFPEGTPPEGPVGHMAEVGQPPTEFDLDDQFAPPLDEATMGNGPHGPGPGGPGGGGPGGGGPGPGGGGETGPRRPALPPRTVQLLDAETGDVIAETTTNSRGEYRFGVRDGLRTGTYQVRLLSEDGSTDGAELSEVISVTRGGERFGRVDFGVPPGPRGQNPADGSHGAPVEQPEHVRFYRAYNPTVGSHFFTASQAEFEGALRGGYQDETTGSSGFEILAEAADGAVPLFRLYNLQTGRHYYTANALERDYLVGLVPAPASGPDTRTTGWRDEGIAGYIYTGDVAGTTPIYRLYNSQTGSHLFTENTAVRDAVLAIPGGDGQPRPWQDHGVVGRAFSVGAQPAVTQTGGQSSGANGTGSGGPGGAGQRGPGGGPLSGMNPGGPTGAGTTGTGQGGPTGPNGGLVGGPNVGGPNGGPGGGGPGGGAGGSGPQGPTRGGGPGTGGPGQGGPGGGARQPAGRPALSSDVAALDLLFTAESVSSEL